jgi:GntR family transcriptional regulator
VTVSPFPHRPAYLALRDGLARRITSGEWHAGSMLPNEMQLAAAYGVSPGTMRKALELLEEARLINRRQGRGTFVVDQAGELAIRFSNIRDPRGARVCGSFANVAVALAIASSEDMARLCLAEHEPVHRIARTRTYQGLAFMREQVLLPAKLFPQLTDEPQSHRIVELARTHSIALGRADEHISLAIPDHATAAALGCDPSNPVLTLERTIFTLAGAPVEWRIAWCALGDLRYVTETA